MLRIKIKKPHQKVLQYKNKLVSLFELKNSYSQKVICKILVIIVKDRFRMEISFLNLEYKLNQKYFSNVTV
jgi:hypothetical protein